MGLYEPDKTVIREEAIKRRDKARRLADKIPAQKRPTKPFIREAKPDKKVKEMIKNIFKNNNLFNYYKSLLIWRSLLGWLRLLIRFSRGWPSWRGGLLRSIRGYMGIYSWVGIVLNGLTNPFNHISRKENHYQVPLKKNPDHTSTHLIQNCYIK